jgi:hypothetical protein
MVFDGYGSTETGGIQSGDAVVSGIGEIFYDIFDDIECKIVGEISNI